MTWEELLGSFKGNDRVYEALLEQVKAHRVTPVFGAGMSVWANYPLWKKLLSDMASNTTIPPETEKNIEKLLESEHFERAASMLEDKLGSHDFQERVKAEYDANKLNEENRPNYQRLLPALFKEFIVTTNFDMSLERLFNFDTVIVPEDPFRHQQIGALIQTNSPKTLVKLHGSINDISHIVLTEARYNQVYGSIPDSPDLDLPIPKTLYSIFQSAHPLFLGCGLGSDRTSHVLRECAKNGLKGFALVSLPEETQNKSTPSEPTIFNENGDDYIPAFKTKKAFLNQMGLQVIWYPYGEHDAVRVLVEKLSEDEGIRNYKNKGFTSVSINTSIDDSILQINENYVAQCLIEDNEKAEETKAMFHNFRHTCDITFKMLINKLAIRGDEYENICQTILDLARSTTLTFLTNDRGGGIGKSVMLCAVALLAFEKRLDVFYLKDTQSSLPELSGEALFLIDDALDFQETIQKMHEKYKKSSRIHIIMADRVVKTRTLYDELESDVTDWLLTAKAVVLSRQTETIEIGFLKKDSVIRIDVSDELICSISNQLIANRIAAQSLTPDISIPLNYKNKNIMDVVFDYFLSYNKVAETQANMGKYEWDWDEWGKVPELKGLFKYVAALYSCGVHVSTTCLERIQRGSMEALHSANLLAIRVENNFIQLRHDTVADHFFAITKIPPSDTIIQLLENDWLDEDTVVRFEKRVFSLRNIKDTPPELKTYSVPKLLYKFSQNTNYRQILRKTQRIHSLELATIMQKNKNGEYDDKDALSQAIGASFDDVESSYHNKILLWIKYFNFTARIQTILPSEMLKPKYIGKDGLYKKITSIINRSYLQPKKLWYADDEIEYIFSNSEGLFKSIISNIDATDKPSRFALSDLYLKRNMFIDAVKMIQEIESLPDLNDDTKYACATKTLKIYKIEKKYLRKRCGNQFNNRIRILDGIMGKMYEKWITYCEENDYYSMRYTSLIASYAVFLRTKGNFGDAYTVLHDTIEDFEKHGADSLLHRVYNAMGQLYQDPRYNEKDLNIAEQYFRKGKECTSSQDKKSIMSSLKPLCKTMLESGNYKKSKELCKELFRVDPNDPEIFLLMLEACRLEEVQEQQLPIGSEFDLEHKQWLEGSSETEISEAVAGILKEMTDIQHMFADEFGCNEKYKESSFLKDSYIMIHCIFNNRAIPINLQTEWIIDRNKRHSLRKKYFETQIIKAADDLAPSDSSD